MADNLPSVENRLLRVLAGIAVVAILGVLAILPYRLYARDIRHAQVHAHRVSSVVQAALGDALRDGRDVTDLINRLQGIADLDIRLSQIEAPDAEAMGRPGSSRVDGTDLTYVSPPIVDRDGHAWLARMHFDLAPMKRESVRLIIDLVLAVVLGSAVFSLAVYLLVHRAIALPLRRVTEAVDRLGPGDDPIELPSFQSREMSELTEAVERACRAHRSSG